MAVFGKGISTLPWHRYPLKVLDVWLSKLTFDTDEQTNCIAKQSPKKENY